MWTTVLNVGERITLEREKESAECLTKDTKEGHCQLNYDKDETERGYFWAWNCISALRTIDLTQWAPIYQTKHPT